MKAKKPEQKPSLQAMQRDKMLEKELAAEELRLRSIAKDKEKYLQLRDRAKPLVKPKRP
ncbi:hypothetical protein LJC49_03330 [Ruminococcaceae bacterium OttesenSCG-928-I18]|nr:hypothetical protein [Ruminococcaceae bacterium OttesenSCG-928-I18]